MSLLIGQVYYPRFNEKVVEGETKTSFGFSLATRKAFIEDSTKPNLFTPCITYQAGLAKLLNEHFGKEEHNGKGIALYGHFNEFDWYPDADNKDHDKFWQPFNITNEYLTAGGIRLAEGSATEMTVQIPVKQTTRQFVVTGFEFTDSSNATRTPRTTNQTAPPVRIGGATINAGASTVGAGLPTSDGAPPF